jgi:hypothetical protein
MFYYHQPNRHPSSETHLSGVHNRLLQIYVAVEAGVCPNESFTATILNFKQIHPVFVFYLPIGHF